MVRVHFNQLPLIEEGLENRCLLPPAPWVRMRTALSRAPLSARIFKALGVIRDLDLSRQKFPSTLSPAQSVAERVVIPLLEGWGIASRPLDSLPSDIPMTGFFPLEIDDGATAPSLVLVLPPQQDFRRAGESAGLPILPPTLLASFLCRELKYTSAVLTDGVIWSLNLPGLDPLAYGEITMDLAMISHRGLSSELSSALGIFFPQRFGGMEGWNETLSTMDELGERFGERKPSLGELRGMLEGTFDYRHIYPRENFFDDLGFAEGMGDRVLPVELSPWAMAVHLSGVDRKDAIALAGSVDRAIGDVEYERILNGVRILLLGKVSPADVSSALLGLCFGALRAFAGGRFSGERKPFSAGELLRALAVHSLLAVVKSEEEAVLLRTFLAMFTADAGGVADSAGEPPFIAHRVMVGEGFLGKPPSSVISVDEGGEEVHLLAGNLEAIARNINSWRYQRLSRIYREQVAFHRERLAEMVGESDVAVYAPDFFAAPAGSSGEMSWEEVKPGLWLGRWTMI